MKKIEEKEIIFLDKICKALLKEDQIFIPNLYEKIGLDSSKFQYLKSLLTNLEKEGLIHQNQTTKTISPLVNLEPFVNSGGFKNKQKNIEVNEAKKNKEEKELEKIREFQIEDLEHKVKKLEDTYQAQMKFWKKSSFANSFFWLPILISAIALGISCYQLIYENSERLLISTYRTNGDIKASIFSSNNEVYLQTKWKSTIINNSSNPISLIDYEIKQIGTEGEIHNDFLTLGIESESENKIEFPLEINPNKSKTVYFLMGIPLGPLAAKRVLEYLNNSPNLKVNEVEKMLVKERTNFFDENVIPVYQKDELVSYTRIQDTNSKDVFFTITLKSSNGNYFSDATFWYKGKEF